MGEQGPYLAVPELPRTSSANRSTATSLRGCHLGFQSWIEAWNRFSFHHASHGRKQMSRGTGSREEWDVISFRHRKAKKSLAFRETHQVTTTFDKLTDDKILISNDQDINDKRSNTQASDKPTHSS